MTPLLASAGVIVLAIIYIAWRRRRRMKSPAEGIQKAIKSLVMHGEHISGSKAPSIVKAPVAHIISAMRGLSARATSDRDLYDGLSGSDDHYLRTARALAFAAEFHSPWKKPLSAMKDEIYNIVHNIHRLGAQLGVE